MRPVLPWKRSYAALVVRHRERPGSRNLWLTHCVSHSFQLNIFPASGTPQRRMAAMVDPHF